MLLTVSVLQKKSHKQCSFTLPQTLLSLQSVLPVLFLAVVKCDPLKPSPHGSLQSYDPVEEFAYGSTCWVKCDLGFVRNGTNATHCTAHGNWSHILPVCNGNLLLKHTHTYIYTRNFSLCHKSNRFT